MIPTDRLASLDLSPDQHEAVDKLLREVKPQCDKAAAQTRALADKLHADLTVILTPDQLTAPRPPMPPRDGHGSNNMPPGADQQHPPMDQDPQI
jgi:hypothetical protein